MRKLSILILGALLAASLFAQAPGPGPDSGSATAPNRRLINEPGACQIGESYYNMTTNLAKICTVAGTYQTFAMTGNEAQAAALPFTVFSTLVVPHDLAVAASATDGGTGYTYWSEIFIPVNATLTGACWLNATTVTTDSREVVLWNSAGAVLAAGAAAGVADTGNANKYECQAFATATAVPGPGTYFVGFIVNGNTDTFFSYTTASSPTTYITGYNTSGTYGTPAAIVPGAAFVTAKGPLMWVY